jgi:ABC-type sugar transport system substrate-binding protein
VLQRVFRIIAVFVAGGLLAGCDGPPPKPPALRIALVSKAKGNPYFAACEQGAREAARELGVQLFCEAPVEKELLAQVELIDSLVNRGMDVIAIAPRDAMGIAPALKRAKQNGVKVITFDSDADEKRSERAWFVRPVTDEALARALADLMARLGGPKLRTVVVSGAQPTAGEQVLTRELRNAIAAKYPLTQIVAIKRVEEDQSAAFNAMEELLQGDRQIRGVFALTPSALPAAAGAVQSGGFKDTLHVTGICLPSLARTYVNSGIVRAFLMWNPVDLGYLTVQVAQQVAAGKLPAGAKEVTAGRLGKRPAHGSEVLLGDLIEVNAGNIKQFNF